MYSRPSRGLRRGASPGPSMAAPAVPGSGRNGSEPLVAACCGGEACVHGLLDKRLEKSAAIAGLLVSEQWLAGVDRDDKSLARNNLLALGEGRKAMAVSLR